jgi:hypothetical protein
MELTDKQIEAYQDLYRKRFGIDISREEAYAEGMNLIQFIKTVHEATNRQDKKTLNKKTIP